VSSASAGGTIAAVRSLGARDYDVGVLYNSPLSAAVWSRHVARSYRTPRENETELFLERLMEIGARRPGQILLASSDETAWLYAESAAMLSSRFIVHQPPVETLRRILDKSQLAIAAARVGMATPPTWSAPVGRELAELARSLPYPILIKPRTHVQRVENSKGVIVHSGPELMRALDNFIRREKAPGAKQPARPLLQRLIRSRSGPVSITGFLDRAGDCFVTRRCVKVFQRLSSTGVGLCFEALPPDEDLSEAVRRLCGELGFFGLFEAEFLPMDGRWALIDFNPRLFNQVALDIYRDMPLPLLACLDAVGDRRGLREAVDRARAYDQSQAATIHDRFTLRATLLAKAIRGANGRAERDKWKRWIRMHASHMVDFVADRRDRFPGAVHVLSESYLGLRALPRFLRETAESAAARLTITAEKTI
jgi:predicted ATP-grasp superfamily ATP-dependent carboligase